MIHLITDLPIIHHEMLYFSGEQTLSHCHARFLCLLHGELSLDLKGRRFDMVGGDIIFLPEETAYKIYAWNSALILYACLHPYFVLQGLGTFRHRIQTFYSDTQPEQRSALSARIAGLITQSLNQEDDDTCGIYAKAYDLLDYLSHSCIKLPDPACPALSDKAEAKLLLLEQFIGAHYTQAIALKDAAAFCGYTPQYLASFLKKHLNLTFQEYLNSFRLEAARLLLSHSQEPPAKIAFLCGFPNQSSFLHCFEKAQGMTAEDFRTSRRQQLGALRPPSGILITNTSLIQDYIFNYMNYAAPLVSNRKETLVEHARIPASSSTALKPIWSSIINLGSARDYEKPTFRHQLAHLQLALHFTYSRCTEVFSLVKVYATSGKKTYDFSQLFRLIDYLKSLELKPFFDIDAKPFRLYKSDDGLHTDYNTYLSAESYDAFLLDVLPEFVKACITRYGFDEFSTWKFELWRRYNTNMSSLELPEAFCRRFQKVASILKSLAPDACLGGPGFNGFLPTGRFHELMEPFVEAEYQPDFISAYYFPYAVLAGETAEDPSGYRASATVSLMAHKLREWKDMLTELGFGQTPFYITEYSAHVTLENYVNDSTYPATYIFYQSIQNQGVVDGLGYWLATDLSLEYGNPNSPLFGGNGLLSKNGIPKPPFHAHDFLNRLGSRILMQGEHYVVTSSWERSFQILIYYCGSLKQSFADAPANQELLQYPYSAFEDMKPLELSLTLTELLPGKYRIKEYSLDLNHGSVMRVWGQLGHSNNLTPDEVQYMEAQSVPSLQLHTENLEDSFLLHTTLNPNEARLYLLTQMPTVS